MKRIFIISLVLLVFCLSGCSQESYPLETGHTSQTPEQSTEEKIEIEEQESLAENTEQTEYIGTVPEEYFAASDHAG